MEWKRKRRTARAAAGEISGACDACIHAFLGPALHRWRAHWNDLGCICICITFHKKQQKTTFHRAFLTSREGTMRIDVWDVKDHAVPAEALDCGYPRDFEQLFTVDRVVGKGGFGSVR